LFGTSAWGIFAEGGISSKGMMALSLEADHQQNYFPQQSFCFATASLPQNTVY